jgi:hypothetical protein
MAPCNRWGYCSSSSSSSSSKVGVGGWVGCVLGGGGGGGVCVWGGGECVCGGALCCGLNACKQCCMVTMGSYTHAVLMIQQEAGGRQRAAKDTV